MARVVRAGGVFLLVVAILWTRFSLGFWRENEATRVIHWGMFPIAVLLGVAAGALEASGSGSPARRDVVWGMAAGVFSFAALRLAGLA